jgi:hypothetical protein
MTDRLFSVQPDFDSIIPPLPRCEHTNVMLPNCGCRACCLALVDTHRPPDMTDRGN